MLLKCTGLVLKLFKRHKCSLELSNWRIPEQTKATGMNARRLSFETPSVVESSVDEELSRVIA